MKKILVIDDAEFILESTSTLLKFEGFDVCTASDGSLGILKAFSEKPDLILCDISMPILDGFGVLEKVRSNDDTISIPFIFLTAFTDKSNMRSGMEKGADDYLVKPFTRDELLAAIEAQFKKSSVIEKQLQDKVEEVGRSISNALPHEFRTVLNQVVGSAKYLQSNSDSVEPTEILELSEDIISSSQRLLRITENYLIHSRIEIFAASKDKKLLLRSFKTDEPCAMLYDIALTIADKFGRSNDILIDSEINSVAIEISTESFHKIVDELLDNALKFSEVGSTIHLTTEINHSFLVFNIKDNGRGMTSEQIAKVGAYVQFERDIYEQQGVGLGLMIAKKMVELHDGKFEITSQDGSGTLIRFTLPLKTELKS